MELRNKILVFFAEISVIDGPEMKLPTDNRLAKKSEKSPKYRDFISRAHMLEFLKKYP